MKTEALLNDLYATLTGMLNTDVRKPNVGHLCYKCCSCARECALKISDALVSAIVEPMSAKLPSTSKYYTLEGTESAQNGLFMIHQLGEQVIPNSIGAISDEDSSDNDGGGNLDDAAAFRRNNNKRAKQAVAAADSFPHRQKLAVATWIGEPIKKLNNELQHLESVGDVWYDVADPVGVVYQAEADIFKRVTSNPSISFTLDFLKHHFKEAVDDDDELAAFEDEGFQVALEIAGLLYAKTVPCRNPPVSLLRARRFHKSSPERQQKREEFLNANMCCLDPGATRQIRLEASVRASGIDTSVAFVSSVCSVWMSVFVCIQSGVWRTIRMSQQYTVYHAHYMVL